MSTARARTSAQVCAGREERGGGGGSFPAKQFYKGGERQPWARRLSLAARLRPCMPPFRFLSSASTAPSARGRSRLPMWWLSRGHVHARVAFA